MEDSSFGTLKKIGSSLEDPDLQRKQLLVLWNLFSFLLEELQLGCFIKIGISLEKRVRLHSVSGSRIDYSETIFVSFCPNSP